MFDIKTPDDYLHHIKRAIEKYKLDTNKKIERLFFVLTGLNHLREWIAPHYFYDKSAVNNEQKFYNKIYELKDFKTINNICNGIKHLQSQKNELYVQYDLSVDEWDDVDSIQNVDLGSASDFYVNDKNIIEIIDNVLIFYENEWFGKNKT